MIRHTTRYWLEELGRSTELKAAVTSMTQSPQTILLEDGSVHTVKLLS